MSLQLIQPDSYHQCCRCDRDGCNDCEGSGGSGDYLVEYRSREHTIWKCGFRDEESKFWLVQSVTYEDSSDTSNSEYTFHSEVNFNYLLVYTPNEDNCDGECTLELSLCQGSSESLTTFSDTGQTITCNSTFDCNGSTDPTQFTWSGTNVSVYPPDPNDPNGNFTFEISDPCMDANDAEKQTIVLSDEYTDTLLRAVLESCIGNEAWGSWQSEEICSTFTLGYVNSDVSGTLVEVQVRFRAAGSGTLVYHFTGQTETTTLELGPDWSGPIDAPVAEDYNPICLIVDEWIPA